MEPFEFVDAITGDSITLNYDTNQAEIGERGKQLDLCTSIFFPGCSYINYAMPLVGAVYATLESHGIVDGLSVLCCGKILSYEPDGQRVRDEFELKLLSKAKAAGIRKIVCACPNCVKALREAIDKHGMTYEIEVAVLPIGLSELGYRVDVEQASRLLGKPEGETVTFSIHDSCPDRVYGEFADGLRQMLEPGTWYDPVHCRRSSICCGSLPRAAGKNEQADKCADLNGREAVETGADLIVTSCFSCAFQLNMAQEHLGAIHFLECLYNWRVNWDFAPLWMKIRFLFEDTLNAKSEGGDRQFVGLSDERPATASDEAYLEDEAAGRLPLPDVMANHDVAMSNANVTPYGE